MIHNNSDHLPDSQLNITDHLPGSQLNITSQVHKLTDLDISSSQRARFTINFPGWQVPLPNHSITETKGSTRHGFKAQIIQLMCSANLSGSSQHLKLEQLQLASASSWLESSSSWVFSFSWGTFSSWGLLLGGLLFLLGWPSNVFSSRLLPANKTSKCV